MNSPMGSPPVEKISFWRDPEKRAYFFQFIAFAAVAAFIAYFINNAYISLNAMDAKTGFDFLGEEAKFGILQTLIDYDETYSYGRAFIVGLLNTLIVAVIGIFLATILGFIIGVARLSDNWVISKVAAVYIEIFRNIPLLLQIFFWYIAILGPLPGPREALQFFDSFFLSNRGVTMPAPVLGEGFGMVTGAFIVAIIASVIFSKYATKVHDDTGKEYPVFWINLGLIIGLPLVVFLLMGAPLSWDIPEFFRFNFRGGMTIIPEFIALLIALTVYTAAFIAEVVRSGIEAIPKGQTEASAALGLPAAKRLRFVIIPQAMRVIIPPLTNQYLNLTKNSSLATAIAYPDLVSIVVGTTLNQTGQSIEPIFMTMAVYLFLSLSTSAFMNWYNSRMALVER